MNHIWTRRLALGGSLIMVLAYMAFDFLPWRAEMSAQVVMLQQRQQLLQRAAVVPLKLSVAKQELQETSEFCQQWREQLPAVAELRDVQGRISDAAAHRNLRVAQFDPGDLEPLETLTRMPLKVELRGAYGDIVQFIAELESLDSPVWVERASIAANREENGVLACELSLTVFAENSDHSDYVVRASSSDT